MILLLDIGNTSTKFSFFDLKKDRLSKPISVLTYSGSTITKIIKYIKSKKIKFVLASSVVPKIYNSIKKKLLIKKIKTFEFKDHQIKKFIKININKKSQVGSDRILNAIGSSNLYKKNCIIVDFGTTTTFDIVDRNKIYQGGVIAPGINLSLKALNRFTAKLPLINIFKQKKVIGKDTRSAINSGVFIGYSCLINGIIKKIEQQSKKKYLVVLTGGYAKLFDKCITFKTIINKDITLQGLALTVKDNKEVFSEKY